MLFDYDMDKVNLFTFEGYHTRYCQYLGEGYTGKKAWEKTEDDYITKTEGVSKYSSFESFKSHLSQRRKKNKVT
jgi:hypothetical protein